MVLHQIPVTSRCTWNTGEQQDFDGYDGDDWRDALPELGVIVEEWNPPRECEAWSPVHHADLCRWEILSRGGIVADTDIVWVRPISDEHLSVLSGDALTCEDGGTFSIGLVSGARGGLFSDAYRLALSTANPSSYQGCGTEILYRLAFGDAGVQGGYINWHLAKSCDPLSKLDAKRIPKRWVHPFEIHRVFSTFGDPLQLPSDVLGIHWYGGSQQGQHASRTWRKPLTYGETVAVACRLVEEQ